MKEHSIVEDLEKDRAAVRCLACGSSGTVRYRTGPPITRAELAGLAWGHFLKTVPWDCDEALVAGVMRR